MRATFADGNVRLKDGKYPEISIDGMWSPICGHWFWESNIGAKLFCRKLNSKYVYGTVVKRVGKIQISTFKNCTYLKKYKASNGSNMATTRIFFLYTYIR